MFALLVPAIEGSRRHSASWSETSAGNGRLLLGTDGRSERSPAADLGNGGGGARSVLMAPLGLTAAERELREPDGEEALAEIGWGEDDGSMVRRGDVGKAAWVFP